MKTVKDFIEEIEESEILKNELKAIKDKGEAEAFLRKYDVGGTVDAFGKAIKARTKNEGELADNDVKAVAGGGSSFMWGLPIAVVPEDPYPQDLPRTKR